MVSVLRQTKTSDAARPATTIATPIATTIATTATSSLLQQPLRIHDAQPPRDFMTEIALQQLDGFGHAWPPRVHAVRVGGDERHPAVAEPVHRRLLRSGQPVSEQARRVDLNHDANFEPTLQRRRI